MTTLANVTSFSIRAQGYQPVALAEAMEAIHELIMSEYGIALPTFDENRHTRARLRALDLEERYLIAGGAQ